MYFSHLSSAIIFPWMKPSCVRRRLLWALSTQTSDSFTEKQFRVSCTNNHSAGNSLATDNPQISSSSWSRTIGAAAFLAVSEAGGSQTPDSELQWRRRSHWNAISLGSRRVWKLTFIPGTQSNSGLRSSHECVRTMQWIPQKSSAVQWLIIWCNYDLADYFSSNWFSRNWLLANWLSELSVRKFSDLENWLLANWFSANWFFW